MGPLAATDAFAWLIAGRFAVDTVPRPVREIGRVVGLVTVEDLVEALVDEILSAQDPLPVALKREADGSVVMPGTTVLRDL